MDNSIEYASHLGRLEDVMLSPSVLYQKSLKISLDGNQYCVLMGDNLQEGIAGFGDTLSQAMCDFDKNFHNEKAPDVDLS